MLEITLEEKKPKIINMEDVNVADCPIMVKRDGKFKGMVIEDRDGCWVVKVDARCGAYGTRSSLGELIKSGIKQGYTFHVNE